VSLLGTVQRGRVAARPLRMLVYGVPGVGKSTLVADAPEPIFADAEQGTLGLDVARVPIARWGALVDLVAELRESKHSYKSLVLDTLDAIERLLAVAVCADNDSATIEDVGGGYGKGWTQVAERWDRLMQDLAALQAERRMNVIALAHANVETFRDPAGADWQRWTLRLAKKSSAAWLGWSEEVLFATRDVQSGKRERGKGKGGERVLYTEWAPGREAKNRRNLPGRLPLDWQALAAALRAGAAQAKRKRDEDDTSTEEAPAPADAPKGDAPKADQKPAAPPGQPSAQPSPAGPAQESRAQDAKQQDAGEPGFEE
jgi:hypothetical protein